jgi:hypothetical protein
MIIFNGIFEVFLKDLKKIFDSSSKILKINNIFEHQFLKMIKIVIKTVQINFKKFFLKI